jgi:HPt (histidine-containing phosphotransfer) domain-containing protein
MERWIPGEKRRPAGETGTSPGLPLRPVMFKIEGLDTDKGLVMSGESESVYREILELYRRDAEERLPFLRVPPSPEDMRSFIIHVHALKSASASIGADALSAKALLLEKAGMVNDLEIIAEHLPDFRQSLSLLAARIGTALGTEAEPAEGPPVLDRETLDRLRTALDRADIGRVDQLLNEMQAGASGREKQILSKIAACVLISEFGEAVVLLDSLCGAGDQGPPRE